MVTTRSSPLENYEEKRLEMQKALDAVIEEFDLQKIFTEKRRCAILDFLLEETTMDSHPHRLIRKNIATSYIYNYVNTVHCQDFIPRSYFQRLQLCPWGSKRTRQGIKSAFGPPRRAFESIKRFFVWAFRQCKCPPTFLQRGKELVERYFSPWASHRDIRGIAAGLMTYLYVAESGVEPFARGFPLSYRDYLKIFHTSQRKVKAWFNKFAQWEQQRVAREEAERQARDRQWAEFQELRRAGKAKGLRVAEEMLGFPLTQKSYFAHASGKHPLSLFGGVCSLTCKKTLLTRILRKFSVDLSIHDCEALVTYWRTHQDLNRGWLGPSPDLFWQIYLFIYCAHRVSIPLYAFKRFIDRQTFYVSMFYYLRENVPDFENSKYDMTAAWHWVQRAFGHLPAAPREEQVEFPQVYDEAAHPELGDFLQLFKIDGAQVQMRARQEEHQFRSFTIRKSLLLKLFHKEYQLYTNLRKEGWGVILGYQGPRKLGHFLFHPKTRRLARLDLETYQLQELRIKCAWDGYIFVNLEGNFYLLHPIDIHSDKGCFELGGWKHTLFTIRQPIQWKEHFLWVDRDLEAKLKLHRELACLMNTKGWRLNMKLILHLFMDVEERRGKYLTSGVDELDLLLIFGFQCGILFEIYGPEGVGKTTLLHQLACTATLPTTEGGLDATAIFIDLEGSLSVRRLRQIASRFKIPFRDVAAKITVVYPPSVDALLYFCEFQLERLAKEKKARLICLDSLTTPFFREYAKEVARGEGPLPPGENEHFSCFEKGRRIAQALKRVVHTVNGIGIFTSKIGVNNIYYDSRPYCQHVGQWADIRMSVREHGNRWQIKLERARDLPPFQCEIRLEEGGFVNKEIDGKDKWRSDDFFE